VDALAHVAEEGRARRAKLVGELSRSFDPTVSEWGNPVAFGDNSCPKRRSQQSTINTSWFDKTSN